KPGLKVTVLERNQIGREASWAAAGMLGPHSEAAGPDPFFDLCLRSRDIYPDFAAELRDDSGVDIGYRDEGGLFVAVKHQDSIESHNWSDWQIKSGLNLQHVSSSELRATEPEVSECVHSGLFIPGDHQVDNRLLMTALEIAILRAGVRVKNCEVTALDIKEGRVDGIISRNARLSCAVVIVAAGCWSSSPLRQAGLEIDIVPAHGQMVSVRGPRLRHVVHSADCYLVPRADGRLLIGATVEYQGFKKAVTAGATQSLISAATNL